MIEIKKEWIGLEESIFLEIGDPFLSAVVDSKYIGMEGVIIDTHGDRERTINKFILDNDMEYFGYSVKWSNGDVSTWSSYCFRYDKSRMRSKKINEILK